MGVRLQFRRYRLRLRTVIRTAHETWTEREGVVVRLEDAGGQVGFGEIAPIPAFGTETVDAAETVLRELGETPAWQSLDEIPVDLSCVRQAVATARREIAEKTVPGTPNTDLGHAPARSEPYAYLGVAALLPAGRAALEQLPVKADAGFRVFKWKVGVGEPADEIPLLDDLCALLPSGAKLRLDANGAWSRKEAERWLDACAERPIEYVEQPCKASRDDGAQKHADDLLLGLAHDYPTPIALDESVVSDADVERWIATGWPGWFVVKPTLLAEVEATMRRLQKANATVVFSSALETAVGARSALRIAFAWTGESKALGFGVWPLFEDPRFNGPAAAPFMRWEDVARLEPEAVWNALS